MPPWFCDSCDDYHVTDEYTCPEVTVPGNNEHRETSREGAPTTRRTCSNCGRLGHLARTCSVTPKSHDKIGIEIEGWWRDLSGAKARARELGATGTSDGSLDYGEGYAAWEFRTAPGSLGEAVNQLVALYPDATHRSAGMHVHVSFRDPLDLTLLASGRFLEYHRARWEAWGNRASVHRDSNFWSRLRGDNVDYCALNRADQLHRNPFTGTRYVQLNFTSYTRHKTLENRMLPLFRDLRVAVSAVEEMVSIYEDFLRDSDALALHDLRRDVDLGDPLPFIDRRADRTERDVNAVMTTVVAPESRVLDVDTDVAKIRPVAPGHVRLFGRRAATEYVRRALTANTGGF